MTIPEFLDRLRQTPADWYLSGEAVRCESDLCPIVAVHGRGWCSERFREAARELGLSYAEAEVIAQVADGVYGTREDLRQQLLAATVERSA